MMSATASTHRLMGKLQMTLDEWQMPNDVMAVWDWGVCPNCNMTVRGHGNVIDKKKCDACSEMVILGQPIFVPKGCLLVIE